MPKSLRHLGLVLSLCAAAAATGATAASAAAIPPVPKLKGTAGAFAGIPWGSKPDAITATLQGRGFELVGSDAEGNLHFTGKNGPLTSTVIEALDDGKKLVKTQILIQPDAADLIPAFHTLTQTLTEKYGKPSAEFENYRGRYRDPTDDATRRAALAAGDGDLSTFWIYADGSSVYVLVTKDLAIEADYESARWKTVSSRREAAAVVAAAAGAADAAGAGHTATTAKPVALAYVGPPGWNHAKGTSDGLGTWLRTSDAAYPESVTVEARAGVASLDALLTAEVNYIASLPDQFGYAPTDTTVCHDHPAKYLSYTYTGPDGNPITAEVVIAVFGTTGYRATYDKTITQNADPAAEQSLTTLCAPSASLSR